MKNIWNYFRLKKICQGHSLPLMIVDLDVLEANAEKIRIAADRRGKKIRIASKSIRVPYLIKNILDFGKLTFQGVMTFSRGAEAVSQCHEEGCSRGVRFRKQPIRTCARAG